MDPDDVTRALAIEPDRVWRHGEQKKVELPGGTKVLESRSEASGWKKFAPSSLYELPAHEQLDYWLDVVRSRSSSLASLRALGHQTTLDCFVASSEVIAFSPDELAAVAAARLDLVLTISADD
jgi:hypothetical protein